MLISTGEPITVPTTYAKNGESRCVPMNDVLTTTLKAVRMNTLADSGACCSYKTTPSDPSAQYSNWLGARLGSQISCFMT
jgi:hypothetical protein